jgi:hypothetical protein
MPGCQAVHFSRAQMMSGHIITFTIVVSIWNTVDLAPCWDNFYPEQSAHLSPPQQLDRREEVRCRCGTVEASNLVPSTIFPLAIPASTEPAHVLVPC